MLRTWFELIVDDVKKRYNSDSNWLKPSPYKETKGKISAHVPVVQRFADGKIGLHTYGGKSEEWRQTKHYVKESIYLAQGVA